MKLKELMEKLETLQDKDRLILHNLVAILTPISKNKVMEYQQEHTLEYFFCRGTKGKNYEKFCEGQNDVIKRCVNIELSDFGNTVREKFKLERLTEDTEISDDIPEEAVQNQTRPLLN